jgi:hypothetical protein
MKTPDLPFSSSLPQATRREPRVWVKELAVYREWKPDALQRRISMRKGLNIIWAEPSEQGAGGHAAGKTTFCRFLRYLLGDSNYGNDTFRDAFRNKFPNAWVVGEVHLDGVPWLVARFVGVTGSPHWSSRGVRFDKLFDQGVERLAYADFTRALQKTFIQPLPVEFYPGSGKEVDWAHLLAWLSRDQEARYDHVLDWRSGYGGASSLGDIHSADRTLLIRTVLGLTQPGELEARRDHMQILRDKNDCDTLIPKLSYALKRAEKEYRRVMAVPEATITESTLTMEKAGLGTEETRILGLIREMRQRDGAGDLLPCQRDKMIEQLADLAKKLEDAEADGKKAKLALDFHEGRITQEEYRKQLAQMPLRADQCSAPLELAVAHKCKLAEELHPNRFSEHVLAELKTIKGVLQTRASSFEEQVAGLKQEQTEAKKEKQRLEKQIATAQQKHQQRIEAIEDDLTLVRRKHETTSSLLAFTEELETERKKSERLQSEQRKSTDYQETLRQKATAQQSEFSDVFSLLAGRVLQSENRGVVRFQAEDVKLEIDYSDLTSTALTTLKILIFDLAGLIASARQSAQHPGILIHDSPREADLTAAIYRRIFDIAKGEEFNDEEAPIQYIITTTEPPPEKLNKIPWLVHPPFSSQEKERRFLRENI